MGSITKSKFKFGTKAETLERIAPLLKTGQVAPLYYFTVAQWRSQSEAVLNQIQKEFISFKELIVRSSAQCEDTHEQSMAGAFHSCLHIDVQSKTDITKAIDKVISSYQEHGDDQVLVQPMISDVAVSGVVMTYNLEDGAPYYVINYDDFSGRTDSVTGGTGVHKTVLINHQYQKEYIQSKRIKSVLDLVEEVKLLSEQSALDIEFGLTHNEIPYLFQVRPICLTTAWEKGIKKRVLENLPDVTRTIESYVQRRDNIFGEKSILTTMSDWNPAEMIGVTPKPLAFSLYRKLITQTVWRLARQEMKYSTLPDVELMTGIMGRPYIDVRNSFNSLLPEGLTGGLAEKMVNAWLDRLREHPELHDKVEFDVMQTCVDFSFEETFHERYGDIFTKQEYQEFKTALSKLTKQCLNLAETSSLRMALTSIDDLAKRQNRRDQNKEVQRETLGHIQHLIDECKELGTFPFSIIARHAFIVESLLRSMVKRGAITAERMKLFKRSIVTVASEMAMDIEAVSKEIKSQESFLKRYGHLRPGTYDITSLCYSDRDQLFNHSNGLHAHVITDEFLLTSQERVSIENLLKESDFGHFSVDDLLEYMRLSIVGREYGKFVFTKNISDILESLAVWGGQIGLSREDISHLTIESILNSPVSIKHEDQKSYFKKEIKQAKSKFKLSKEIKFCYILRDIKDMYVLPLHRSAPNFIGTLSIVAPVIFVDSATKANADMTGKIVCIENADPGFDWIFTKDIAGVITKYGGANSHMAIRCAEFGLLAAIGCGEGTFERLVKSGTVELNCGAKALNPLYE